jgi:Lanthionine synthetase C-like protein
MAADLFESERHEALCGDAWNADRVDAVIADIVAASVAAFERHGHWPSHPADSPLAPRPSPSLYDGTAGVVWALAQLGARLPTDLPALLHGAAIDALARIEEMDVAEEYRRGLLLGPSGVHAVSCAVATDTIAADALYAIVHGNIVNPVRDFMWGASGTMLAAQVMFARTGELRWREVFCDSAVQLLGELAPSPSARVPVWNQHLYGFTAAHIGAGHGFAGNIAPVLVGRALLPPEQFESWRAVAIATTMATAMVAGDVANWPQSIDGHRPGRTAPLVQWCHGAPGIVISLGELCDGSMPEFDALLLRGGELTWRAGPLRKGAGLCHGTAGNGFALLRLYAQTGDECWLDRARAFAMHALAQVEAAYRERGERRHSLWTGDIGVALYLRACQTRDPRFPSFQYL